MTHACFQGFFCGKLYFIRKNGSRNTHVPTTEPSTIPGATIFGPNLESAPRNSPAGSTWSNGTDNYCHPSYGF
ncbi:unnamed protein product [Pieris brassicae]|uniref:Uncharacterized protein n=1 Tax=Pieris brassicae TaxID=7116 RepID=A0A9P0TRI2_PIEBR|nr:unnamed protein product [Pieris brassicae]